MAFIKSPNALPAPPTAFNPAPIKPLFDLSQVTPPPPTANTPTAPATTTPAAPAATNKTTYADIGAKVKARDPRLANFADDEVGKRMAARDPRIAAMVTPETAQTTAPSGSDETTLGGFAKGVGKSVLGTVEGLSSLGERFIGSTLKTILPKAAEKALGIENAPTLGIFKKSENPSSAEALQGQAEQAMGLNPGDLTEARTPAQQAGKFAGDVAQFLLPVGDVAAAGDVAKLAAEAGGAGKVAAFGAKVAPQVAKDVAISEAQTGGKDHENALLMGLGGAAGEGALNLGSKALERFGPGLVKPVSEIASKAGVAPTADAATEAAAKKVVRTGLDKNVVDFVRSSHPEDKAVYPKMLDMAEKAGKDLRNHEQPMQIAGNTILKNAEHLINVKDQGVAATKKVLDNLGGAKQNVRPILLQYMNDLKDMGIRTIKRGNSVQMISEGKIPESDLGFFKTMYGLLSPDKEFKVERTFNQLHSMRQRVFNELDLAKARQQPFSDTVTQYGEKLRQMLAQPIDEASKGKYMASQTKTAQAMGALQDFVRLMGHKGNLEKLTTKDLKAGEVASRILGNAADRPMTVINNLVDTAKKYGFKGKGNWMDQVQFADLLENFLGTRQTRSLRGQAARAGEDVLREAVGTVKDVASHNVLGLGSRAVKAILGQTKEAQVKALKELLKREAGALRPTTVFGK